MPEVSYVLALDSRPTAVALRKETAPSGLGVVLKTGPRGIQGETGAPGFILVGPDDDIPPSGTPDGTFVFQQL